MVHVEIYQYISTILSVAEKYDSCTYQSRPAVSGGTRKFIYNGVSFGWRVIEDMYYREVERSRTSQCSRIPNIKPRNKKT